LRVGQILILEVPALNFIGIRSLVAVQYALGLYLFVCIVSELAEG